MTTPYTPIEGTRRFVVKRALSPEADVFAALPREFRETIREVHFVDGSNPANVGLVGAYSIDLDEEFETRFARASNLREMVAVDSRVLDAIVEHTTADEIRPMEDFSDGSVEVLDEAIVERFWKTGPVTDQGREGACVGHAGTSFLTNAPKRSFKDTSVTWLNGYAYDLYKTCQRNDEWAGENYSGTSCSALMRVLRAQGFIEEAVVSSSWDSITAWKQKYGPVVMSLPWFEGCYVTDSRGFIRPTGRKVGGHAILDSAISKWGTAYLKNSWGTDFGKDGIGYVSEPDYRWWLNAGGRGYATNQVKR